MIDPSTQHLIRLLEKAPVVGCREHYEIIVLARTVVPSLARRLEELKPRPPVPWLTKSEVERFAGICQRRGVKVSARVRQRLAMRQDGRWPNALSEYRSLLARILKQLETA